MDRLERIYDVLPAGPPLEERQQVGRGSVISGIEERLRAREVLLLMEGRRTGKTSVAVAALDRIRRQRGRVAVVTLTRFTDPRDATRFLARQLQSRPRRATQSVVSLLRALDLTPVGELLGSDAASDLAAAGAVLEPAIETAEDLSGLLAAVVGARPTAVLLDEAHALVDWPAGLLSSLNAVLRAELRVGVVIASSDTDALKRLTERGGALHLVGSRVSLPPITTGRWLGALRDAFAQLEIEITETTLQKLIELTNGHPYLTMRLARDSARIASDIPAPWRASGAELEAALYELRRDPVWSVLNDDAGD